MRKDLIHDTHQLGTRLRTDGKTAMSRGFPGCKQIAVEHLSTEKEELFISRTIMASYWKEVIIVTFLEAVNVLTACANDLKLGKTRTVRFAC